MAPFDTFKRLFPLDRVRVRLLQVGIDAVICLIAFYCAYAIRFEGDIPETFARQALHYAPFLVAARAVFHVLSGVYRVVWRYVGVGEALLFVRSVAIISVILLGLRLLLPEHLLVLKIPISVIVLEGTFTFLGMCTVRLARRILHERRDRRSRRSSDRTPTLLVGAGQGGLAIAKETQRHPELGMRPVGFLDDDVKKQGMHIAGLRVLGPIDDAEEVLKRTRAERLLITSNAIDSAVLGRLMELARKHDVDVRTVPGLFEILGGEITSQSLREVRIEDLLSRDPIPPSMSIDDLTAKYQGLRIMVTGAGGSIGSELCRQLARMKPERLLLLERDENNLFEAHRELSSKQLVDTCAPVLCDITDAKSLEAVFRKHRPQVVFHAAAFKHVPMMERFPTAAVRNNVFGTKTLAELSAEHDVESFVMISTDKAVKPTSVMGATKRLAEMIVQNIGADNSTRFSCVRFGNVLGSRGSVVPIFREQILRGGPVTVTHPEATRYFMTIPEAANLVLQAATLGESGEVFLLDMGEPVKIIELARKMIQLLGFTEEQCPIKIIGTRPGEKLFEELRTDHEQIGQTDLRKIYLVNPETFTWSRIEEILDRLDFSARARDSKGVRQALGDLGIGYTSAPPTTTSGSYPVV